MLPSDLQICTEGGANLHWFLGCYILIIYLRCSWFWKVLNAFWWFPKCVMCLHNIQCEKGACGNIKGDTAIKSMNVIGKYSLDDFRSDKKRLQLISQATSTSRKWSVIKSSTNPPDFTGVHRQSMEFTEIVLILITSIDFQKTNHKYSFTKASVQLACGWGCHEGEVGADGVFGEVEGTLVVLTEDIACQDFVAWSS